MSLRPCKADLYCWGAVLILLLVASGCARTQNVETVRVLPLEQLYAYDRDLPLNAEVKEQQRGNGYVIYRVQYNSVHDKRVPAWWCVPAMGTPPYPCVIIMHGYGGDKNGLQMLAPAFALRGIATLAIDAEYHGDRKQPGSDILSPYPYRNRDAFIQTVIDLRRAIDFLQSRQEIDAKRIGYIGLSMGGILGGILAGVDERVQAPILIVAGGDWGYLFSNSQHPTAVQLREKHPELFRNPQKINEVVGPIDPVNWVARISPRPLLMINGKGDQIVPKECTERLFAAAKEPKEIVWLEGGHMPQPDLVLRKVDEWLTKHLLPHPASGR
ncbi:MAG: alpha/beta fold hydrolase [Armatimonadota bacterium]|nr:acetylxylan esterase [bacterium]MDW8320870.1 alpha/beta fold hydrolase [Armatimonadota bacterium]